MLLYQIIFKNLDATEKYNADIFFNIDFTVQLLGFKPNVHVSYRPAPIPLSLFLPKC